MFCKMQKGINCMETRKARISKIDTVLNMVSRKLEIKFVIFIYDDNCEHLEINFKEDDEQSWNTLFSLMELYCEYMNTFYSSMKMPYDYENHCNFDKIQGLNICVLQGESHGIAFAPPLISKWVVYGVDGIYSEEEAREILIKQNQGK